MPNTTLIERVYNTINKAIKDSVETGDREAVTSWRGAHMEFMQDPERFCSRIQ